MDTKIYMVDDQPHEVSSDQESQFLKNNPSATLQSKESNNSKSEKDPNTLFINEKSFILKLVMIKLQQLAMSKTTLRQSLMLL